MSRLRSNKVVNQAGTGASELTYGAVVPATGTISGAGGINVSGIVTAASFSGDGSALTGVGDPSAIKDGSNVKVQAISTGANVTGNLGVSGDATVTGNLTVNGTTTTIDTAVTSVDSLAVDGNISAGGTVTAANIDLADNARLKFGTDDDLQIHHNNSNSVIEHDGTGNLYIQTTGSGEDIYLQAVDNVLIRPQGGEDGIKVIGNAGVELYYDNSKKLETIGYGVSVSGTGSIKVPVGTTGERPTPAAGMFRYNTTEGKFEGYTTEWGEIGGGGGGLTTEAHVANNAVVTLDLTAAVDHKVTATGICTITCTGGTEAQSHTIRIINSGITTVGFSTYFLFPSGATPSLPSADGAINLISFTVNRVGAAGTQLLAGASLNFS